MTLNKWYIPADRSTVTRLALRDRMRARCDDSGFSMIEIVFALLIIALVTTASLAFFINNLRSVDGQGQRQQAVYLANQQLETVQSLPVAKLVQGRTSTAVTALMATPAATKLKLSTQDDVSNSANYDPTATASSTQLVPTSQVKTVNKVNYTVYTFINTCWYDVSSGLCGPTTSSSRTQEYRVSVDVGWTSKSQCTGGCDYSTSTLVDPTANPQFNSNISAPTGSYTSVGSNNNPGLNPNVSANSPLSDTCKINGTTVNGTKIVVNGSNFKSGMRVWISNGGGTISNIYQPVDGEVDFCYATTDVPGAYTISVINTDGGHFQLPITVVPSLTSASGWTPSGKALTVSGTGFQSGATFTVSGGGASATGSNNLVANNSSGDSAKLVNYVGPKDGNATTLTVTNTDGSTATLTLTAPKATALSMSAIVVNTSKNLTLTGTGFQSGMAAVVVSGSGTATVSSVGSSTSATLQVKGTAAGTMTVYVYNPDGGFTSTFSIVIDPLPTVTSASPDPVSAGVNTTVTVNGTGFLPGMTASTANGSVGSVTVVSSTKVTFTVNPDDTNTDTITLTNTDGGTATFSIGVVPNVVGLTPTSWTHNTTPTWYVSGYGFASGATVTVSGNGFTSTASNITRWSSNYMIFNARIVNNSSNTYTFTVKVTNPDGTSDSYTTTHRPS